MFRTRIGNTNARSIQLFFKKFVIPDGAKLFIYNSNKTVIAGAFTSNNVQNDSTFMIADFMGNHVIIEYFEPDNPEFEGQLIIGAIGQAYKDPYTSKSDPGFININCPIGKDAQLAKHAVARMSFRSGLYQASCSGALINNTRNDGKPYFLTAHHCISLSAEAISLITYFNYEVVGCSGDTLTPLSLSGSSLLSTYQSSDFTLLLLNEKPTSSYQPYYAGWNAFEQPATGVTGVHIPAGETKKISIDYDTISTNATSISWDDKSTSPPGSHWRVSWDIGKTAGGSSGSPLFNSGNQIIGQLHGGDSQQEFYGRFDYSYTHRPSDYQRMAHYLDPDSTNIRQINGYSPADNIPDAFFVTPFEQVCHNAPIIFTDYSVFGPYERSWKVFPSTFSFVEGTTDSSANPVIRFLQDTTYIVTLDLSTGGPVVSTENNTIKSAGNLDIAVAPNITGEICDCNFNKLKLTATGAQDYSWSVIPESLDKIILTSLNGDTTSIIRMSGFKADSSYVIGIKIIGSQETCSDSIYADYNIIKPANDDIKNAKLLNYGRSDFFSNVCATIEPGEPVPPFTSCTSQDSWCDEYGNGKNIVEHSVWFKFIGGETGRLSISSYGFDDEIALYSANNYEDILSGNYTLVGANDDRSSTDSRPLLTSEPVTPGKMYWIQVDGSGGGLEDNFYMVLTSLPPTSAENIKSQPLMVYPQPARDIVFISNSEWSSGKANIKVYNVSGSCIFDKKLQINDDKIILDVTSWDSGVYIGWIEIGASRYIVKISKMN